MQTTKTKNLTEICKVLSYTLIILGAVLIFTAPFWHVGLPKETTEILFLREKLQIEEKKLLTKKDDLRAKFNSGKTDAKEFIALSDSIFLQLKKLKAKNDLEISEAINAQRIFSWKSPRAFLVGFGVRLPYVFFSLVISLLVMSRKNDPKYLKSAFSFLQIACWSISAYWMIWVFWDFQDYSLKTYRYVFITVSILIGTACVFFISSFETTISTLKSKIRYVMGLMINKAIDKGHIKDELKYETEIIFPALKKLDE